MKIFVAGGTGVVGSRAVPVLVAAGHDVTVVARGPAKADLVRSFGAEPVVVDLFDPGAVQAALVGHEAVVNLATNIPNLTDGRKASAWAVNDRLRREASGHLADAALVSGAAAFVQESICFPYDDQGDRWIDEDHPADHVGPFAGSAVAEASAARFAADGGRGVVLRFAQFYAPDSSHTQAFNRLLRRRINPFVGPPGAFTSSIHATDAGTAVLAALRAPSGTYNVGDDEPLTRADAGTAAAAALGKGHPVALPPWAARAAGGGLLMKSLRISNRRFREATGWAPVHPSLRGHWPVTR